MVWELGSAKDAYIDFSNLGHRPKRMQRFQFWMVVFLVFGLAGCVEFEDQEVHWRYSPQEDEIVAILKYQGIYGGDGKQKEGGRPAPGLSDQEKSQLEDVMKGGRAFFFNNWISEFNRTKMKGALEDLAAGNDATTRKLLELMLSAAEVGNLGFYLDKEGRLCGAQTFKLRNVSGVLALTNSLIKEKALENIRSKLDGGHKELGAQLGEDPLLPGSFDLNKILGRLEKVGYGQMRLSGITKINGKYQIHIDDLGNGQKFWLKEGKSILGFQILEVNPGEGFAKIRKNSQTAKVHLRSKEIVPEPLDRTGLKHLQHWAKAVEREDKFLGKTQGGFYLKMPLTSKQFEDAQKGSPFPSGMDVAHDGNWLTLAINGGVGQSGVLVKRCFPGYAPNAVEHVRTTFGFKDFGEVMSLAASFFGRTLPTTGRPK
jgi:hypothetical protein